MALQGNETTPVTRIGQNIVFIRGYNIWMPLISRYLILIDCIKVLHPTGYKIHVGHFGDVLPSQSLGIILKR